jgi:creatinine amidohydrolase
MEIDMGRLLVSEIVWTEVKKNLNNIKLAIVPAGSCEQHGPNTTFTTDTDRANEFCKLLGERIDFSTNYIWSKLSSYGISRNSNFRCQNYD